MQRTRGIFKLAISFALLAIGGQALADNYPAKPIKIIVPFPPGGSIDMVARLVGKELADDLKQPVVVDNKPGASGNIGMDFVAKSPKDGYTLLLAPAGLAANPHLYAKLSFSPFKDLAPIIHIADQPNVMVVNTERTKATTLAEFIAHLKANAGKASFGTAGVGSAQDVAARMFMTQTGTDMLNVPYKGGAPALADLLGGQIDLMFETSPTAVPYARSGKLRALAVTSDQRLPGLPDVPTLAEAGVPGFKAVTWMGLAAPAGTPPEVMATLSKSMQKIIAAPTMQKQLVEINLMPVGGTAQHFATHIQAESDYYAKLVKDNNITPQ